MSDKPKGQWGGPRPNSGGKREGAGRPPLPEPLKPVTARLSAEDIAYLRTLDKSPSKAIRALIEQARKSRP